MNYYVSENNLVEVNKKLKNVFLKLVKGEILVFSKRSYKAVSIIPFADFYDLNDLEKAIYN